MRRMSKDSPNSNYFSNYLAHVRLNFKPSLERSDLPVFLGLFPISILEDMEASGTNQYTSFTASGIGNSCTGVLTTVLPCKFGFKSLYFN